MSELKPCPFCGNTPDIPKSLCFISVHCAFCEYEMLVERWNTRTPPTLPRVKPEDLVEGEWYIYDYHVEPTPMVGKCVAAGTGKMLKNAHDGNFDCIFGCMEDGDILIYGPLRLED